MDEFIEGTVIVVATGQAGTVIANIKRDVWVLLRNNDIWVGPTNHTRKPQDEADLASCPVEIERLEPKMVRRED
jgi:hypothetical protein